MFVVVQHMMSLIATIQANETRDSFALFKRDVRVTEWPLQDQVRSGGFNNNINANIKNDNVNNNKNDNGYRSDDEFNDVRKNDVVDKLDASNVKFSKFDDPKLNEVLDVKKSVDIDANIDVESDDDVEVSKMRLTPK